ncbi:MAG: glycoside hydrolase family 2 protein, partial [Anaerolineae bacterium]|nr:glycoside hydrolase family 2 protein [Anaerolineae bacterium]
MRAMHPLNYNWLYTPQQVDAEVPDAAFEPVTLPHTNIELPWHNFKDSEYQFISTYRKRFTLPEALNGRRLFVDFEGVMTAATVSINGHTFEEHKGGFVPFSYDITDYIHEEGENLLTVSVDSRERADIPPHGGQVDYLVFGGIYRDVSLRYVETLHVSNVHVRTLDVLSEKPRVEVHIWVQNVADVEQDGRLQATIQNGSEHHFDESKAIAESHTEVRFPAASETRVVMTLEFDGQQDWHLWSLEDPYLYRCGISLRMDGGKSCLEGTFTFGFREAVFKEDGFYLNGEKIFLRGLNRHQLYPFIGAAAPARLQRRDAEIVKEMGCNIVRTSHYPQDISFLDRCDEIGLLVLEEIPGWQHIGDEAWQDISVRDVRAMIERDWNHPSIVLWGVRINESGDNTDFYTRTNELAREMDPTRQTTGIRFWPHSEFLEDVYAYNDFTNGVLEPTHSPWIITEFNGHMFP